MANALAPKSLRLIDDFTDKLIKKCKKDYEGMIGTEDILANLLRHKNNGTFPPDINFKPPRYQIKHKIIPDEAQSIFRSNEDSAAKEYKIKILDLRIKLQQDTLDIYKKFFDNLNNDSFLSGLLVEENPNMTEYVLSHPEAPSGNLSNFNYGGSSSAHLSLYIKNPYHLYFITDFKNNWTTEMRKLKENLFRKASNNNSNLDGGVSSSEATRANDNSSDRMEQLIRRVNVLEQQLKKANQKNVPRLPSNDRAGEPPIVAGQTTGSNSSAVQNQKGSKGTGNTFPKSPAPRAVRKGSPFHQKRKGQTDRGGEDPESGSQNPKKRSRKN